MIEEMLASPARTRRFASRIYRRALGRGDKSQLDEVAITMADEKHRVWHVVDQEGVVARCPGSKPMRQEGGKRLLRKLLKKQWERFVSRSPTSCDATVPPSAKSCLALSIAGTVQVLNCMLAPEHPISVRIK